MLTKIFVVVVYDVGQKRNSKVLKICRKFLLHSQKSVFEGYLDETEISKLKKQLECVIDTKDDQVAIYKLKNTNKIEKETIGYHITFSSII